MRSWSHGLIGLLVGVIVMQWAMPVAQSQPEVEHLEVASLTLLNEVGEAVGQIGTQENGAPYLSLTWGTSHVSLVADEAEASIVAFHGDAWLYGQATPDGTRLWLTADTGADHVDQVYTGATPQEGGLVRVLIDGESHLFPALGTDARPFSWGAVKSRIDRIGAGQ